MGDNALARPELDARRTALREFLMPGIIHSLNNDLFAIRGFAQVLGLDAADMPRERSSILAASEAACATVELIRALTSPGTHPVVGGPGSPNTIQPGIVLPRMCDLLRAPMRDRGAKIVSRHASTESPVLVDRTRFSVMLAEAARGVATQLPAAFRGTVELDLHHQGPDEVAIGIVVKQARDRLPFPFDIVSVLQESAPLVEAIGGRLESAEVRERDEGVAAGDVDVWLRLLN